MSYELAIFPDFSTVHPGFSIHKRPTWANLVATPPSGREVTGRQYLAPLWEFELTFEILRDQSQNQTPFAATLGFSELQTLSSFWIARNAQYGAFVYQDPDDFSRTAQRIATGNGVLTSFVMVRTFGIGSYAFTENVGTVDVRDGVTLNIYLDGVLLAQPGNWWIDTDLRTLRFTNAPANGVVITADFSFFYFCRFLEDSLDMEEFMTGRWKIQQLRFRSTQPDPPASANPYELSDQNTDLTTPQNNVRLLYFEVTFGVFAHPEVAEIGAVCGFATSNFDINQDFTRFNNTAGAYTELNGSNFNLFNSFGDSFWSGIAGSAQDVHLPAIDFSNKTIGVAVNVQIGRYWLRNTAIPGSWYPGGDPVAGTSGATLGGGIDPSRKLKILFGVWWQNLSGPSTASLTVNGAGPFAATIPTGFSAWGDTDILPGTNPGGANVVDNALTGATTSTGYFFYSSTDYHQFWT